MDTPCVFCNPTESDIVLENSIAYARWDKYAVSPGHILIIPFRHVPTYFDTGVYEKQELWELVEESKRYIEKNFTTKPDGYNIGINCGEAAGQTVHHLHIHLIPRYKGDMADPKGGVRGVIPERQKY